MFSAQGAFLLAAYSQIWDDMKRIGRILPDCDFKEIVRRFKINGNKKF